MWRSSIVVVIVALAACRTPLLDGNDDAEVTSPDQSIVVAPLDLSAPTQDLALKTSAPRFVLQPWTFRGAGMIAAGDVDGDGRADLVATDGTCAGHAPTGALHALLNTGNGTFTAVDSSVGAGQSLALGDVDGDGRPDVVTADLAVGVFANRGGGHFAGAPLTKSIGTPVVGDFDGNGLLDALVPGANENLQLAMPPLILAFHSDGSYGAMPIGAPPLTAAALVADLNQDGRPDVLAIGIGGALMELDTTGNTLVPIARGAAGFRDAIVAGNFDHAGLVAAAYDDGVPAIDVIWGGGKWMPVASESSVVALAAADLDGDGNLDLAGLHVVPPISGMPTHVPFVFWARGHGDGTFDAETYIGPLPGAWLPSPQASIAVADLDGDGRLDIATNLPDCGFVDILLAR